MLIGEIDDDSDAIDEDGCLDAFDDATSASDTKKKRN